MNPGSHGRIEELEPFVANVVNERIAEEQMLESEACSYTTEVEQIPKQN